jgi:hypothetical protein
MKKDFVCQGDFNHKIKRGVLPIIRWEIYRIGWFLDKSNLLACSPVKKAFKCAITADLFCTPQTLKVLRLDVLNPAAFRFPIIGVVIYFRLIWYRLIRITECLTSERHKRTGLKNSRWCCTSPSSPLERSENYIGGGVMPPLFLCMVQEWCLIILLGQINTYIFLWCSFLQ